MKFRKNDFLTVTDLNVVAVSSSVLKVSWKAPGESCSANTKYKVEYRLADRDQCQPSESDERVGMSVSETTFSLSNLFPHSTYEIRVSASDGIETVLAVTAEAG